MKTHFPTHAYYSQPFRLEKEILQCPRKVFTCFFETYTLATAKQYLAEWVELACTTDNELYIHTEDRAGLLRFCHFMEEVLEALFVAECTIHLN